MRPRGASPQSRIPERARRCSGAECGRVPYRTRLRRFALSGRLTDTGYSCDSAGRFFFIGGRSLRVANPVSGGCSGGAAQQGFGEIWRLRKGFDWPRAGAFLVKPLPLVESVKITLFGAARRWTYAKSESGKGGFLVRPLLSEYIF